MSRSLKKGPYVDEKLQKKISKLTRGDKTPVKTWARASTITPEMVGFVMGIHTGKTHLPVLMTENMVGHKLGEFAPTRKFVRHGGKMMKEIEQKAAAPAPAAAPAAK
jgi:small subunit ribosomal protein S19